MEQHIKIVAILYIILGALGLLAGIIIFVVMAGAGVASADPDAALATGTCGTAIAALVGILSIPSIIAGIYLQKRRQWARILTIILSVLNLLSFPIGTAIGAYALWVLLNERSKGYFV